MSESVRAYFYTNDIAKSEKPIKTTFDEKIEYWDWVARECLFHRRQRAEYENLRYVSHRLGFTYAESQYYEKIGEEDRKNYNLYILCEPFSEESVIGPIEIIVNIWLKDQRGRRLLIPFGKLQLHERMYVTEIVETDIQDKLAHVTKNLKVNQVFCGEDLFSLEEICPYFTIDEVIAKKGSSYLLLNCEASDLSHPDLGEGESVNVAQGFWPTLMIKWPGQNHESIYPLPELKLTNENLRWSTLQLRDYYVDTFIPDSLREHMRVSIWKGDPLDKVERIEIKSNVFLDVLNQDVIWIKIC